MVDRRPLVLINGEFAEAPSTDRLAAKTILPTVGTLPDAAANSGSLVTFNGKPWFSDGASWVDLSASSGGGGLTHGDVMRRNLLGY